MRKISLYAAAAALGCIATGCVDECDVMQAGKTDMIVIDAMVTDHAEIQTVYIRKSSDTYFLNGHYGEEPDPIKDVTVNIKDDAGWEGWFEDEEGNGRKFCLSGHKFEPGRTYTITVNVGDRTFTSTERMVPSPKINGLKFFKHDTKDDHLWSPILYFEDNQPDEINYYLFSDGLSRNWHIMHYLYAMRLSDEGLRENLDGVQISLGMGASPSETSGVSFGSRFYYELWTISKRNYDFYGAVEAHLTSDGGVYSPTPTTPVTNFSGRNVQGQFIAASCTVFNGTMTPDYVTFR